MRPSRLLLTATLPFVCLALAGCMYLDQSNYEVDVTYEIDEADPLALEAAGQRTCIAAAQARAPDLGCPSEPTERAYPPSGIRVLDAAYVTAAGPSNPKDGPQNGDLPGGLNHMGYDVLRGTNTQRASQGILPAIITPGPGQFIAFLGRWDNVDGDENVDALGIWAAPPHPENEWEIVRFATLYGYVEPGSHPAYQAYARPESTTPDLVFRYVDQTSATGGGLYQTDRGRYILFLDGSLFSTLEVTVVSDPVLAPSLDGRAWTGRPDSRVDVDRYHAVAPGPIASLYGELAKPVTAIGSPSYGTCPNACRLEPVRAGGLPIESDLGRVQGFVWAPYEREWREGGDASAAGRHDEYLERYAGWLDLLPRYGYAAALAGSYDALAAPPGFAGAASQSFPPGYFSFDVWVGVWHDASGEGAVGTARAGDLYEGGNRPLPDDYYNPRGEFIGVGPRNLSPSGTFQATLVPRTDWGPLGVYTTVGGAPVPSTAPPTVV